MPDSAPEKYKKLAEQCCDADRDKRPNAVTLGRDTVELIFGMARHDNAWKAVYHNDVKPLSHLEKESKYSSTLLPTGDLPKPRSSYEMSIELQIYNMCNYNTADTKKGYL